MIDRYSLMMGLALGLLFAAALYHAAEYERWRKLRTETYRPIIDVTPQKETR